MARAQAERLEWYRGQARHQMELDGPFFVYAPGTAEKTAIALEVAYRNRANSAALVSIMYQMLSRSIIWSSNRPICELQRAAALAVWRARLSKSLEAE